MKYPLVNFDRNKKKLALIAATLLLLACTEKKPRAILDFDSEWKFRLGDQPGTEDSSFNDAHWPAISLPHDWSIEAAFEEKNPAGWSGGALPGGIGWYRKSFLLAQEDAQQKIFIQFDGVYRNSEVWINNHYLGKRPYGYIAFQYDLTPYLNYGKRKNVLAVKVDNSQQPNSRWYSGSGIYRDVKLIKTGKIYVDYCGTKVNTSLTDQSASVELEIKLHSELINDVPVDISTKLIDPSGRQISKLVSHVLIKKSVHHVTQAFEIEHPEIWDIHSPHIYKAVTTISMNGKDHDEYETPFGLRNFDFVSEKGFFLNGRPLKINGVCLHHDLGCLGSAFNVRAAERQLEIMKSMGVNAVRTSHNPPATAFLDLCDRMGFIVMDEFVDMWQKKKTEFDYSSDFKMWHERDLIDFLNRDRNHPSVMIWSIGNEIGEQWDSTGTRLAKELIAIVKKQDVSRPIVTANNEINYNYILKSGAFDLIGYNYSHQRYKDFPKDFPGKKFIATETVSGLATRGHYDMPSDSVRIWPLRWDLPFTQGNPDNTVSAYDNVRAPWGATHEETWKEIKKYEFLSGQFIWTGFDYLGEPTPYRWPSRSSYFGVVDLAGFPKDIFYMYQSEWTPQPVLHLFPHWNWKKGDVVDVMAYYNLGDEVELFVNGKSAGAKKKLNDDLHVMWRLPFEPGKLLAVVRKQGTEIIRKEIATTGVPVRIALLPDRATIHADGRDLSFVTLQAVDENGFVVPYADTQVDLEIEGPGFIAGVDNGDPVSHTSLKDKKVKIFHGLALVVVQSNSAGGTILLKAKGKNLNEASTQIKVQ